MRIHAFIVGTLAALTLVACGDNDPHQLPPAVDRRALTHESLTAGDLVGVYRFVYTDDVRARLEAKLEKNIHDPGMLAQAKIEAAQEAEREGIEFTDDHHFLSRVEGRVIFSANYQPSLRDDGRTVELAQFTDDENGDRKSVAPTVVFRDHDTIVMHEPTKGDLVFRRVN